MVTFRNNNSRRNNFRRNERTFKVNSERMKYNNNFSHNDNFQRKISGRNNHNASKLIEKYSNLAREALSSGDKILSSTSPLSSLTFPLVIDFPTVSGVIKCSVYVCPKNLVVS